MFTVRFATLADAAGISEVHCSDIQEWYRGYFDAEGLRQRTVASWEDCSLIDRWEMGGAWMSPDLCVIHLNRLLLNDQIPLVAELDGKIVGELELFIGRDEIFGLNANLSVFYVHRDWRGQGIGTALLRDAIDLVREIGCDTLTTYNPEIPDYYQRQGLGFDRQLKLLVLPTYAGRSPMVARRENLPSFARLGDLKLLSGRILSDYQLYWQLQEETAPGVYAIPAAWRSEDYSYTLGRSAERSFVLFRDRSGKGAWATVHLWGQVWSPALIGTVLTLGHKLGFIALHFIVEEQDQHHFAAFQTDTIRDATVIHCMKLSVEDI